MCHEDMWRIYGKRAKLRYYPVVNAWKIMFIWITIFPYVTIFDVRNAVMLSLSNSHLVRCSIICPPPVSKKPGRGTIKYPASVHPCVRASVCLCVRPSVCPSGFCGSHISATAALIHTNWSLIEASPCVGVHCHIYYLGEIWPSSNQEVKTCKKEARS